MLTHLPIMEGDPVVAFLIAVSPAAASGSAPVYATDRGAPLTTPIKARYDDYGGIEQIEPDSEILAMSFLPIENLADAEAEGGDPDEAVDFGSLRSICCQGAERGRLRLNSLYSGMGREVGLALAHRSAFDAAVAAGGAIRSWGDDRQAREEIESLVDAGLKEMRKKERKAAKAPGGSDAESVRERMLAEALESVDRARRSLFGGHPGLVSGESRLRSEAAVMSAAMDPQSREALIEMRLFCWALESARMDWIVSPGAGSQDDSLDVQMALAHATLEIAQPLMAEREAQRLEDEKYEREQASLKAKKNRP